ncbi:MAG: class II glutamine amidotransferase [Deltaproteobacteria bacterium]|nr:class II glutamine amidotransferase [Deltaproteobacteria bacterium]
MLAVVGDTDLQHRALTAFHRFGSCGAVLPDLSAGHLDGWGMVGYGDQGPTYVARSAGGVEAERAMYQDAIARAVAWQNPVVIVHFRKASQGAVEIENVHPFIDAPWVFCHNGTVLSLDRLGPRPPLVGSSDSEEIFRRWRAAAWQDNPAHPMAHYVEWIGQVEKQCPYSSITALLSDGRELLARRSFGPPLREQDTPEIYDRYYTLYHWKDGRRHIFSSERLPELAGTWQLLANKESVVVPIA